MFSCTKDIAVSSISLFLQRSQIDPDLFVRFCDEAMLLLDPLVVGVEGEPVLGEHGHRRHHRLQVRQPGEDA